MKFAFNPHRASVGIRLLLTFAFVIAIHQHDIFAFNPPVDQQGPLTVRIEGPSSIHEPGKVFSTVVQLENDGQSKVKGTVRCYSIDGWACEPERSVFFELDKKSKTEFEFKITPSANTYSAHYPVHAIVDFESDGMHLTAHPILVLTTDVSPRPTSTAITQWKPYKVDCDRRLSLWQIPIHRSVSQVFGKPSTTTSVGWTGPIATHRADMDPRAIVKADDESRHAITMHPPWFAGNPGTLLIEYPLELPSCEPISLDYANAVTANGEGDGVTFRVRVTAFDAPHGEFGDVISEHHSDATSWQSQSVDLSQFAGQSIRLQLESHPGPAKNTSFDQCFWGTPTLNVGRPPERLPFPPDSQRPIASESKAYHFNCGSNEVDIRPGRRGLLDASIGFSDTQEHRLWIQGFNVRVAGFDLNDGGAAITLREVSQRATNNGIRVLHSFATMDRAFDLVGEASVKDEMLQVKWTLENASPNQPWNVTRIEAVSLGKFSSQAKRIYAGHGNVLEIPEAFNLNFDGHRLATSFVGFDFNSNVSLVEAVDLPPTQLRVDPAQHHYSLETDGEATFMLIPGKSVWELAKRYRDHNGLKAASGVNKLAGRFAFDLWGGRYEDANTQLKRAFRYGLTHSVVVWHNWQHFGYDYRLPEIYPPNPEHGNEEQLRSLIETCSQSDVLFALHDNYIDFYPDADGFSYRDVIAFDRNQKPVKAWLNEYRGARSYRYRADRVTPFLQNNLNVISQKLRPSSYFIDVWSSIRPYDYWTADGTFFDAQSTRDSWRKHFAWIRDKLGNNAPQISESGHDQLIGWLDGAQTNHLRVGKPLGGKHSWSVWNIQCADSERIPWFDAAHHDRFVLHGAGYSSRYQAGLDGTMHGIYSDDYIATEMLTGHPTMASSPFDRDVVRKYWLTHNVSRALALKTIEDVTFVDDNLHHQHVRWSNGGEVWVNRGEDDWTTQDVDLPPFGFLAKIPTSEGLVSAAVCRQDGLIVEKCQSPNELYVNARSSIGELACIEPRIVGFDAHSANQLRFVIDWKLADPIPTGFKPFLHFVDQEEKIAFQAANIDEFPQSGKTGTFSIRATGKLPQTCTKGDEFELRVGFYDPSGNHHRLPLIGNRDDERRIRLGKITVTGEMDAATTVEWTTFKHDRDSFLDRNNIDAKPVDFEWVVTPGSCRITRDGDTVVLTPLPNENAKRTSWKVHWDALPWSLPTPNRVIAIRESGEVLWKRPLDQKNNFQHDPEAFAYRFDLEQ
ncbi:hypothetical protein CA13_13850 [Planctomycetes bacterium CA13]|uniref:Uncharacterized protein n=1 Tax=Novipirellula herctigrandis TaxID=2527986 RepID=A0A5C5YZW3_9BACT|nr:hypothetical protein CA13_13850 [Planctomycetes bacterium CA13]